MRFGNFNIENGILISYEGEEPFVDIPEGVVAVGERAFHNQRAVHEVTLPDSLQSIGLEAFQMCMNLSKVHGGKNVTRVDRDAFAGTPWYKRYRGNETEWKSDEGELIYIGKVLLRAKRNIRHARIPEGTVSIAADAFADCTLMKSIEIPSTVGYIGWRAFSECMCLTHVKIPGTVKRIGWHAFEKCNRMKSIDLEEGIEIMENGVFSSCRSLEKIVIPASMKVFGGWMFFSCVNLEEVRFAGPLNYIQERCFSGCYKLMHVHLREGLERIGVEAFYECTVLQEVILPEGLKILERLAFGRDRYFEKLILPDSLELLEESVFHGCAGFKELTLPGHLKEVPDNTFHGCAGLETLVIKEGVEKLGKNCFADCRSLKRIKMPSTLREIGDGCFSNCRGLTEVILNDELKILGKDAFSTCVNLRKMEIPEGVIRIGDRCFDHCFGLSDEKDMIIQKHVFYGYTGERSEIILPAEIIKAASGSFAGKIQYRKITIPETVKEVGYGAFRNCDRLEEVRILSRDVKTLGDDSFEACRNLVVLAACGMEIEGFTEKKVRMAAALGYCIHYKKYSADAAEKNSRYTVSFQNSLLKKAIDEQLTGAVKYFTENRFIDNQTYPEILEYAQNKKVMETVALLLEYRSSTEDIDAFGKYDL